MACPNRFSVNSVFSAGEDLLNGLGSQVTAFVGTSLANLRHNLLEKEEGHQSPVFTSPPFPPAPPAAPPPPPPPPPPQPQQFTTAPHPVPPTGRTSAQNGGTCEACHARFSYLKRRKQCTECFRPFCRGCLRRESILGGGQRAACPSCWSIMGRPPPNILYTLKVRDLQAFLHARGMATNDLIEKRELVERVMQVVGSLSASASQAPPPNSYTTSGSPQSAHNVDAAGSGIPIVIDRASFYGDRVEDYEEEEEIEEGQEAVDGLPTVHITRASFYGEEQAPADDQPPEAETRGAAGVDSSPQASPLRGQHPSLESLSNEAALESLTSGQLKSLLTIHRVDFRGCCERAELLERATRLWRDNRRAREAFDALPDEETCKICMDAPVDCVLLECGHLAACLTCGKQMSECPICRQFVVRVVRIFKA